MQITRNGTEQFEMIISGNKYSVINILDKGELEIAMKHNTVDFLEQFELPETEYRGEAPGSLYFDHTEQVFYAVREDNDKVIVTKQDGVWYADVVSENGDEHRIHQKCTSLQEFIEEVEEMTLLSIYVIN